MKPLQLLQLCTRHLVRPPLAQPPSLLIGGMRDKLGAHVEGQDPNAPVQTNLEARPMQDSFDRCSLLLGSDEMIREKYLSPHGFIRFGRILEDLDTFSVWLAYKHNQGAAALGKKPSHSPMGIVTACVDRIDIEGQPIRTDQDITLEGFISWVGRSSMEATMTLLQLRDTGKWEPCLQAKFVMVAKHPKTGRSTQVHPLHISGADEERIFQHGEAANALRKADVLKSLLKLPPTEEERMLLHNLFLQTIDEKTHSFRQRILPPNHRWMEDCRLKNLLICFPQNRNLYGKIFGGFLMRTAFELAWANASVFSRTVPMVQAVDDIMFRKSVEVGSLLYLSSEMCYTQGPQMQVRVHAEVVDPEKGTQETTNTFHFTLATKNNQPVPAVMPQTYADGMLYLAGKRHYDEAQRIRAQANIAQSA